jgi:CBS domain-containing protein
MAPIAETTLAETTVQAVMTASIITCDPTTSLEDVAALMAENRVHAVVVNDIPTNSDEPGWAIVSDLDLVGAFGSPTKRDAGHVAATPAMTISESDSLERAAQMMTEYSAAHLIVVDAKNERPSGIISTLDLAGAVKTLAG